MKPLFSFSSPDRKKGRTNEIEKISSFQFTSVQPIPQSKPQKFPARSKSETVVAPVPIQPQPTISLPPALSNPHVSNPFMITFNPPEPNLPILSDKFSGKLFVLLGKFKTGKKQLCDVIVQHSGRVPKSGHLSSKISYLLCGAGAEKTQKYKKAQEKNIAILLEDEFLQMIPIKQ